MKRLYYTSHLTDGTTQADIEDILRVSRKNNSADGITGMLIMDDSRILQFLEGPEDKVEACYQRICRDRRHQAVDFTSRSDAEMRVFTNWSMGLRHVRDLPNELAGSVRALYDVKSRLDEAKSIDMQPEQEHVARMMRLFMLQLDRIEAPAG